MLNLLGKMMNKGSELKAYLTGNSAEKFVAFLSNKTFLKPWVFKSPKYDDGKEFTDVAVFFRNILILIEIKGNKFNPQNPQRYLKEAKYRHQQLKNAERIVVNKSKRVIFKNDYLSFESNFNEIEKIYLISVSTGPGEMEIASGASHIDYTKLDYKEVAKYLGFFDPETNIHSFTVNEMMFASKHIDTLKDFLWYLDFEKKFLGDAFNTKNNKQNIIALIDDRREDMISIFVLNYYWDEELNKTGNININKIFGSVDIEKADMVMYAGSDTRKYLDSDERYKEIQKEKDVSYFWDDLINNAFSKYVSGYKLTSDNKKNIIDVEEIKKVFEEMSFTSRFERSTFSKAIIETDKKELNVKNMFSLAEDADTLFSYSKIDHKKFPDSDEREKRSRQHLYGVWCRIKFGENLRPFKNNIKKTLLITRHVYKNNQVIDFSLSTEMIVDKNICKKIGVI